MALSGIPILSMLRTRMQWHQERQRLLSENVANADTPHYRARDLAQPKFDDLPQPVASVGMMRTDSGHIPGAMPNIRPTFALEQRNDHGVRPTGNAVSLEDEMIKVSANQLDYQAATALYSRSLGLIKTALGKR